MDQTLVKPLPDIGARRASEPPRGSVESHSRHRWLQCLGVESDQCRHSLGGFKWYQVPFFKELRMEKHCEPRIWTSFVLPSMSFSETTRHWRGFRPTVHLSGGPALPPTSGMSGCSNAVWRELGGRLCQCFYWILLIAK